MGRRTEIADTNAGRSRPLFLRRGDHSRRRGRSHPCRSSRSRMNRFVAPRPFADPEAAAAKADGDRKRDRARSRWPDLHRADQLPVPVRSQRQRGRIWAGLKLAIERGWLWKHESGTYVKLTPARGDVPTSSLLHISRNDLAARTSLAGVSNRRGKHSDTASVHRASSSNPSAVRQNDQQSDGCGCVGRESCRSQGPG